MFKQPETVRARTGSVGSALSWVSMTSPTKSRVAISVEQLSCGIWMATLYVQWLYEAKIADLLINFFR